MSIESLFRNEFSKLIPFPHYLELPQCVVFFDGQLYSIPRQFRTNVFQGFVKSAKYSTYPVACSQGFAYTRTNISNLSWGICSSRIKGVSTYGGKTDPRVPEFDEGKRSYFYEIHDFIHREVRKQVNAVKAAEDLDKLDKVYRATSHEAKNICNSLYHHQLRLVKELGEKLGTKNELTNHARNSLFLSQILANRVESSDILLGLNPREEKLESIAIYKKFDKIVRFFIDEVNSLGITIHFDPSNASENCINASSVFEIIPFIIFDNVFKYAPNGSKVGFSCKDNNSETNICITSYGPPATPDEKDRLFDFGFRAKAARSFKAEGSGIGLSVLKTLVEKYSGNVEFRQIHSDSIRQGAVNFVKTEYRIKFAVNQ